LNYLQRRILPLIIVSASLTACGGESNDSNNDPVNAAPETSANPAPESNPNPSETPSNGLLDSDDDGFIDSRDAFPLNPAEYFDTDHDGIGNNADNDDDQDGIVDSQDAFPLDKNESKDTDGDGAGDNVDGDIDGDGISNEEDVFPLDATEQVDLDGDGIGDVADTDDDGDGVLDVDDDRPRDPLVWDLTGPEVLTVIPANSSVDVSRHDAINVQFNEAMLAITVDDALTLSDGISNIPATVTYDPETLKASLQADERLGANTDYTATVSADIRDDKGNPMAADFSWDFTTAGREFGKLGTIDVGAGEYIMASANNNAGDAVVIIRRVMTTNPTRYTMYGSAYSHVDKTWTEPQAIQKDKTNWGENIKAVMDEQGIATIAWEQPYSYITNTASTSYHSLRDIWATRFYPGINSWATAAIIDGSASYLVNGNTTYYQNGHHRTDKNARDLSLVIDKIGNVAATWNQDISGTGTIYASRLTSNQNTITSNNNYWGTAQKISGSDGKSSKPFVTVDSSKNISVVWGQSINREGVYYYETWFAQRNQVDGQWSDAVLVPESSINSETYSDLIHVVSDKLGNLHLLNKVRMKERPLFFHYTYSQFDSSIKQWLPKRIIGDVSVNNIVSKFIMNAAGDAVMVREERDADNNRKFYRVLRDGDTGIWQDDVEIPLLSRQVMIDDSGNQIHTVTKHVLVDGVNKAKSFYSSYSKETNAWNAEIPFEDGINPVCTMSGNGEVFGYSSEVVGDSTIMRHIKFD
jgi:hypothetical protein